jgi:hypothetical protein
MRLFVVGFVTLSLAIPAFGQVPARESAAQTPASPAEAPPAMAVTDARPKPEITEFLGFFSTDCGTGIRRLGEEKTSSPRLAVLQHDLREALGNKYAGSQLLVSKYSIFNNMSHQIQASNPGANDLVGRFLVAQNCTKKETTDGWFSADEITNTNPPVIVEIEASLNGKSVSARVVYSPPEDIMGAWGLFGNKAKGQAALSEAMRRAHTKLIEQIQMP